MPRLKPLPPPSPLNNPPARSCLMECHAVNLRVVYVDTCVNISGTQLHPSTRRDVPHPRRDPFGNGHWIRPAFRPGRRDPPLPEPELLRLNRELGQRLARDGAESARAGLCSSHGLFTPPMPWKSPPAGMTRTEPACHCFPGWFGLECERQDGPADPGHRASKQSCVHGCTGRGVCRLNFCHCLPGTWGVDCSSGTPEPAAAEAAMRRAEAQRGRRGVWPIAGWTSGMTTAGRSNPNGDLHSTPTATASSILESGRRAVSGGILQRDGSPADSSGVSAPGGASPPVRIYVYELPPRFNIWLAAHFRRPGRWDQSYLYSLDLKIHRCVWRTRLAWFEREGAVGDVLAPNMGVVAGSTRTRLASDHSAHRAVPTPAPPNGTRHNWCAGRDTPPTLPNAKFPSPLAPPLPGPFPTCLPLPRRTGGSCPPRTARWILRRPTSSTCPPTCRSASTTRSLASTGWAPGGSPSWPTCSPTSAGTGLTLTGGEGATTCW
eukprot:scaffold1250_cov106-Isochrysis_galbana.AAC.3